MLGPAELQIVRTTLIQRAGGWLRNPIRQERVTCLVCTTPCKGYTRCFTCHGHVRAAGSQLADRVAPMTYALAKRQSGYVMRGYKAPNAPREHREYVAMLGLVGLGIHATCPERLAGTEVTHWSAVPSLPAKPGEHPLHRIIAPMFEIPEAPLVAARTADQLRAVSSQHFLAVESLPAQAHVLLVDDTWTSGGHAQSAALALRAVGAAQVSILTIARWIDAAFGENRQFLGERLQADYDPSRCPWTGSDCP